MVVEPHVKEAFALAGFTLLSDCDSTRRELEFARGKGVVARRAYRERQDLRASEGRDRWRVGVGDVPWSRHRNRHVSDPRRPY